MFCNPCFTKLNVFRGICFTFEDEYYSAYHNQFLTNQLTVPTLAYLRDYDKFTGTNIQGENPTNFSIYSSFKTFKSYHYPLVFGDDSSDCSGGTRGDFDLTKVYLQMSAAALVGRPLTQAETNILLGAQNAGCTNQDWLYIQQSLYNQGAGANTYPQGLEDFDWSMNFHVNSKFPQMLIRKEVISTDVGTLLGSSIVITEETVIVSVSVTEIEYVE